jgi:hypothetical protein
LRETKMPAVFAVGTALSGQDKIRAFWNCIISSITGQGGQTPLPTCLYSVTVATMMFMRAGPRLRSHN